MKLGQALIEYLLMLIVALSLVTVITGFFRKSTIALWGYYTRQISAACPGCPPNPGYRFR